jgi:hypothetical protein
MEHASVAAFARFALQLLSVGAPPELLRDTQSAMMDETEHARLCFALASDYAGHAIGPSRLSMDSALEDLDERAILIAVIREGCIGETIASLEAAEALEHATDPAVRAALARITVDERRHALLAYQYVAWAVAKSRDPEIANLVQAELAAAERLMPSGSDDELLSHGMLGDARRAEIRRQALQVAVRPSLESIVEGPVPHIVDSPFARTLPA